MTPEATPIDPLYAPIRADAITRDYRALLVDAAQHPGLALSLRPEELPPQAPTLDELRRPKPHAVGVLSVLRLFAPGVPEALQVRYPGVRTLVRQGQEIVPAVRDLTFGLHFGPRYPLELGFSCSEPLAHPNMLAGITCPDYRPGLPLLTLVRRLYRMAIFEVVSPEKAYPLQARVLAWLRQHPEAVPTQDNRLDASLRPEPVERRLAFQRKEAP